MPDDLLDRLDAQARANRETRSGFLRASPSGSWSRTPSGRRDEVERAARTATARDWVAMRRKLIREDRESH